MGGAPLLVLSLALPSLPVFKFPLPRKPLHAKWWIQAIGGVHPLPLSNSHFWPLDLHPSSLSCCFSETLNVLDSQYLRSRGSKCPKTTKNVILMAFLVNWSSTLTSGTRSGPQLRGNRPKGYVGSIEASVGGDISRLSPINHWGTACLLFYLWFLKLKMFLSQGIAGQLTIFQYYSFSTSILFPTFLPRFPAFLSLTMLYSRNSFRFLCCSNPPEAGVWWHRESGGLHDPTTRKHPQQ